MGPKAEMELAERLEKMAFCRLCREPCMPYWNGICLECILERRKNKRRKKKALTLWD